MMTSLKPSFSRCAAGLVLAAAAALSGCATTRTDLSSCMTTKEWNLNLLLLSINAGSETLPNHDCRAAREASMVTLMRNAEGTFDPIGLTIGKKFHDIAEPPVKEFFAQYLGRQGIKPQDLERLADDGFKLEIQNAERTPVQVPGTTMTCRTDDKGLRRCRYQ